jgi:DNA-binding XRE family transcriptional regulator
MHDLFALASIANKLMSECIFAVDILCVWAHILRMTLREARRAAGLTQAELAAKVRCDQAVISRLEAGQVADPSHRLVVRISRVLGVDPQQVAEFRVRS